MGRNYYLCRGYISDNWKSKLTKVLDNVKSLELIDLYTMAFDNLEHFKTCMFNLGFISSLNEDLVIARNETDKKTKEKILRAIYLKDLIFKEDLELLGISGSSYKELAKALWRYIVNRQNNRDFMTYITRQYVDKYTKSERKRKAPIFESGDISTLAQACNYVNPDERLKNEYELCFTNFFRNEIYKCEEKIRDINLNGRYSQPEKVFEPIDGSINQKGFHDLLIHIIRYAKMYEYDLDYEEEYEEAYEFDVAKPLEQNDNLNDEEIRDYEIMIKNYAETAGIDLKNPEEVSKSSYLISLLEEIEAIENGNGLNKKYGMD